MMMLVTTTTTMMRMRMRLSDEAAARWGVGFPTPLVQNDGEQGKWLGYFGWKGGVGLMGEHELWLRSGLRLMSISPMAGEWEHASQCSQLHAGSEHDPILL